VRKFATVTASLLARKGEAAPSHVPVKPVAWARRDEPSPAEFKTPHDPNRPRRLFVPLSHEEHEKLAIAAVKKNATPHQIVHTALQDYFQKLAADAQCQCIAGVCTRDCAAN
jgi:hypothetical protein